MPSKTGPLTFRLPLLEDTFSEFPDNGLNPHYSRCRVQSRAWINKYDKIICGSKMRAFMENCNFELSTAYVYPYAPSAGLRATMDLANVLWLYDEFTDTTSGHQAHQAAAVVCRTLQSPDYDDGSWICHMMKDFYTDHIGKCGPNVAHRFINHFCKYVELVGVEAELREKNHVLDINAYIKFRRETSAVRTCFDLVEYCLGLDLPQHVHDDAVFVSGYNAAMDLVFWTNDLLSYNMEQAKGHGSANIVTVIMKSKGVNLQTAVDLLADYCESLTFQLLEAQRTLASQADLTLSRDAVRCLEAFGDWVRGNIAWSFETERYFGKENKRVKETRIVELREPFQDAAILEK